MARVSNWKLAGEMIPIGADLARDGVEADLAQIERACREIAFCELADVMARSRIVALRGAVSGCRAEMAENPDSYDLRRSMRTLEAELSSFEETLPIECAYRADQRDMAFARLNEAQVRLRGQSVPSDGGVRARVQAALALSPVGLLQSSREQVADRLAAH